MKTTKFLSFRSILLLALLLLPLYVNTPAAAQLNNKAAQKKVVFMEPHNNVVPIPAQQALQASLQRTKVYGASSFYVVSADVKDNGDWYIGSFTDTDLTQAGSLPKELYSYVIIRNGKSWIATVEKEESRNTILSKLSENQLSTNAKNAIFSATAAESTERTLTNGVYYKLPWSQGQTWQVTQGWHGGSSAYYGYPGNVSIDFDIVGAANGDILAMAPGLVTKKCYGYNGQGFLKIKTAGTNDEWGYLHLDAVSIQALGVDVGSSISQGQKLGVMKEDNNPNGPVSDNCGTSYGTHFHLYFPFKPASLDGVVFTVNNSHNGALLTQSTNSPSSANCSGTSANVVLQGMTINGVFDCHATNSITLAPEFKALQGSDVYLTAF